MELESEEGSRIPIDMGSNRHIGRELGLGMESSSSDRTVSRRHLSLHPIDDCRVEFEVTGKNPVLVCRGNNGNRRIYKSSEKGELRVGDKFSLSLKKPYFFAVKRWDGGSVDKEEVEKRILEAVERREKRTLERREKEDRARREDDIGSLDISQIDPVKEFGFLLKGHEFDQYPKRKIPDIRSWNWFLDEEPSYSSDDDETTGKATSSKRKSSKRSNKKKGRKDDDDDEWTGDSEEEIVVVPKVGSIKRPKYSTRSKDRKKTRTGAACKSKPASKKDVKDPAEEGEEEDEEDETLGGFIVDEEEEDENLEEEESVEESEEEFEDEDEEED